MIDDNCCFRLNPSFEPRLLPRAQSSTRVCGWTILMLMPSHACATTSSLQSAMLSPCHLLHFAFFCSSRAHSSVQVHPRLLICDGQRHVVPIQQPKHRAAPRPHSCVCAVPTHWPHGRHLGQVQFTHFFSISSYTVVDMVQLRCTAHHGPPRPRLRVWSSVGDPGSEPSQLVR